MHDGPSHHQPPGTPATSAGVQQDLLTRHERSGNLFKLAVVVCGGLFVLGVVGFVLRLLDGVSNTAIWGYHAAVFAFILTTAQAAPMVAIAPRLARAHWRRPISRAAELFGVVGLFNLLLFIPMLWVLPSLENGRRSLWFFHPGEVASHTPHLWATLALVFLVITGLAMLWVNALPDLAVIRDGSRGRKHRIFSVLARGWHGTSEQWNMLHHRVGILGAFYFMMLVFTHFLIATDFLITLVPGWVDALYPATHAANAIQAAAATVLVTMFVLRQWGGYREYIGLEQFWGLGKLLFALSLLWFWFWFSSFIVYWYGRKPSELAVLDLFIKGPYLPLFYAVFALNFVFPLVTMIWNFLRKSIWGPTMIAVGVLAGTFLDRIRMYVGAYSVADQSPLHQIERIPVANKPDAADVFILVGAIAGSVLVYLLATRIIPPVSIWEQKELLLYRAYRPFHRIHVRVMGKSE